MKGCGWYQTVQFDTYIGPFQVQPLRARVDLEVMAMKEHSVFPKAPALLESQLQNPLCHIQDTRCWGEGSYLSAKIQSVCNILTQPTFKEQVHPVEDITV